MGEKDGLQLGKTGGRILLSLVVVLLVGTGDLALPDDKLTTFTADQMHVDPHGKIVSTGKLYVMPEKIAMDGMPAGPQWRQPAGG